MCRRRVDGDLRLPYPFWISPDTTRRTLREAAYRDDGKLEVAAGASPDGLGAWCHGVVYVQEMTNRETSAKL